jgi:hypothetical protein
VFHTISLEAMLRLDNLRPGGPLGGCSPRLCWLRTDGLAPTSKYWTYRSHTGDMGPVRLVACHQQRVALPPLFWFLSWERNWVQTYGSVSRRAVECVRSSGSIYRCWWLHERLLCVDHVRYIWSGTIRGLSVECMWRVGQVSPTAWLSDMSNRLFVSVSM